MAAAAATAAASSGAAAAVKGAAAWSPQQKAYRALMVALRAAYMHDRHALFWARHRAKVEVYKYASLPKDVASSPESQLLLGLTHEVAEFVGTHLPLRVERIKAHNDKMLRLSVPEAKRFRAEYLEKEAQHDSWCRQKIFAILQRRPPPPFPYC